MKRQKKFPETNTFHYYNANPKNRISGDCVIRALCTAMQKPYKDVYKELFDFSLQTGYILNDKKCFERYLKSKGWVKHKQPRKTNNCKYTGKEFCCKLSTSNNGMRHIIANIGGHHIVAIIDFKIWDIWDSTDGCIGNYWTKL